MGANPHENPWISSLLEHSLQVGITLSVLQEGKLRLRMNEFAIVSQAIGSRAVNIAGQRRTSPFPFPNLEGLRN